MPQPVKRWHRQRASHHRDQAQRPGRTTQGANGERRQVDIQRLAAIVGLEKDGASARQHRQRIEAVLGLVTIEPLRAQLQRLDAQHCGHYRQQYDGNRRADRGPIQATPGHSVSFHASGRV